MTTKNNEINLNELGKIYEVLSDIKYIRMVVEGVVKSQGELSAAINGNGKPGLKQELHDIKKWHEENDYDIKKVVSINNNQSYLKKGTWEVVRWIGSGTVLYVFLHFIK